MIHLPGWGFFDVPAGYGWKITLDDKCGCIFPMEAFENVGCHIVKKDALPTLFNRSGALMTVIVLLVFSAIPAIQRC